MKTQQQKRLVAVAFNVDGALDFSTLQSLRHFAWRDSDHCQVVLFNDASTGGQAAFVFEIYDIEGSTLIQRIRHFFRKLYAATLSNVWKGVFLKVSIKSNTGMFPMHGA